MKDIRSKINALIQKRLIEGTPNEQDYEVFEKVFDFHLGNDLKEIDEGKQRFLQNFISQAANIKLAKEKIKDINKVNNLSEFLQMYILYHRLDITSLSIKTNLEEDIITKLLIE